MKWIIFKLTNIHLVVGSPWQYRHVKMSPILRHLPVHYIPYGVDTRVFFLRDRSACRARFGIPNDADVISFRSVPFSKNFKGTEYIIEALKLYQPRKKTYLLTLEGVGGLDVLKSKYEMVHLAWTNDDRDLIADVLNAADIFLMPSLAEAFGLMAIESLACGTPVIVFDGTALPETINVPNCGIAVPMKDHVALSQAIDNLLGDPEYRQKLAGNGLKYVKDKHTFEMYADNHLKLYQQLVRA
jgi:glycosyltransferase involved in cell wall biosynthesis